jgi:hypothetical protein
MMMMMMMMTTMAMASAVRFLDEKINHNPRLYELMDEES